MNQRVVMDMVKRDRFELLSAYLDGEVTADERRQVEAWLATDASVKCLYVRLLKLRQGLRTLPIPADQQLPEVKVQRVLTQLRRRSQLALIFGGVAVAACVIGLGSNLLLGGESKMQLAQQPKSAPKLAKTVPVSPLMVALNNPVIEIPKAAVVSQKPPNPGKSKHLNSEQDIN